jgi:hypothetical protein
MKARFRGNYAVHTLRRSMSEQVARCSDPPAAYDAFGVIVSTGARGVSGRFDQRNANRCRAVW